MQVFLISIGAAIAAIFLGAAVLHTIPKLGSAGRSFSTKLCRAPLLDLLITYFTVAPMIAGAIYAGWIGLAGAIIGQVLAVTFWGWMHELANLKAARGPRIVKSLNQIVGRWRNHTAVWITALAVPLFWLIRIAEWVVYPPLTVIIGLPKYRSGEWVNVSRQKFNGLVGHDLIWCLYCDWMTGVWSLGSEMLRNVESFWCPIRFYSEKKCENCAIDFPDINGGWVPADGTMQDVTKVIEEKYTSTRGNAWFGHPVRLTVSAATENGSSESPQSD